MRTRNWPAIGCRMIFHVNVTNVPPDLVLCDVDIIVECVVKYSVLDAAAKECQGTYLVVLVVYGFATIVAM